MNHSIFIRADVHTVTCEFHHSGSSFNSIASTCVPSAEMLGSFRPCDWENSVSCHMLHLSAANALKKALASTFSGSGSLRSLGDATFWKAPGKTTWLTQHFKRNFQRTEHKCLGLNQCEVWKHSWTCSTFDRKVTHKVSMENVLQQDSHLNINVLQLTCHPYHGADHRLLASEFSETMLTDHHWLVVIVVKVFALLISKPAAWCAHEAKECERVLVRRIILDGLCIVFRVLHML